MQAGTGIMQPARDPRSHQKLEEEGRILPQSPPEGMWTC